MSVHPWGARLTVVDPPVEPQSASGLILPVGVGDMSRGIVIEAGEGVEIETGSIVWYHSGHEVAIGDVKVVKADCVVAWSGES